MRRLVDYWRFRSTRDFLPVVDDIDPIDFALAWGYVCLIDVLHDGLRPRFRFRLDGSKLSSQTGDWTGRHVDEIALPQYVEMTLQGYQRNVVERVPLHHLRDLVCDGMSIAYEAVALPLRSLAGPVGRLPIGVIPKRRFDEILDLEASNSVDLLLRH